MLTRSLIPFVLEFVDNSLKSARRPVTATDINNYLTMLRQDASAGLAYLARCLTICNCMGEYSHDDEGIKDEVNTAIARMRGSRNKLFYKLLSFIAIGYSFTEKVYDTSTGAATFGTAHLLDPRKYDFEGKVGEIDHAKYKPGSGNDIYLPYEDGIHLINEDHLVLDGSPYGVAAAARAYPWWELHKITLAACAIAIQRQATPLLVGKTDTSLESVVIQPDGSPLINPATNQPITVNAANSMRDMLLETKESAVAVIDRLDEIESIAQQTDGQFFQDLLYLCSVKRMESFLVPATLYSQSMSGVGDSNLADRHGENFLSFCRADADYLGNELVEQWIRPMLEFNRGELEDYGHFVILQDQTNTELLTAITDGVQRGAFSNQDLDVLNRARELAGIPATDTVPEPVAAATAGGAGDSN